MNTATEMANDFSKFVNGASADTLEEFASALTNDHRTLQQVSMKTFLLCIAKWSAAKENGRFDDRNEATVLLAHQIHNIAKDSYLPYI